MISFAKIDKNVVIVGADDKIEIWDKNKYSEFKSATDKIYNELAEQIDYFNVDSTDENE
jgi:DNA-binding transcriptional regulator/RsmH inhibitor MraZ